MTSDNVESPCSVLFVDIADHTQLYTRHGAAEAAALVRRCLDIMREVIEEGTHDELIEIDGHYAKLCRTSLMVEAEIEAFAS